MLLEGIQSMLTNIKEVNVQFYNSLSLRQNWLDLQDRIYNRAQYYKTYGNSCISDARNVAEVNVCCDNYIQRLNNDFYNDVLKILKDY
ncbi:unnamed protein product (macronuclear) [Paramecium tetraurelia]|uniref:Uncharacterized protein n=1 Tax=Paramecium tetraurelia TaxID=5888 RepID=A0EC85_PARTE|nr:uncharacterized protein GSPATT00025638001 [Paramecium tetraurelia]CAK92902.1 unnamed protein product [Paramecium tetraurelia]|eukprot:XP_001460299.1 hypothetical protein (macronuclear) [Paramecium tetraurelia strain d4-2]